jgi:hypothetical protein
MNIKLKNIIKETIVDFLKENNENLDFKDNFEKFPTKIVSWDSLTQIADKKEYIKNVKNQMLEILEDFIQDNNEIRELFGQLEKKETETTNSFIKKSTFFFEKGNFWQDPNTKVVVRKFYKQQQNKPKIFLVIQVFPLSLSTQEYFRFILLLFIKFSCVDRERGWKEKLTGKVLKN